MRHVQTTGKKNKKKKLEPLRVEKMFLKKREKDKPREIQCSAFEAAWKSILLQFVRHFSFPFLLLLLLQQTGGY